MERPVAWVYVVAMNQARCDFRRARRQMAHSEPVRSVDVSSAVVTAVCLETSLGVLPPRQRAAVVLRYLADLSTAGVSYEAMGCAQGTVKSALHEDGGTSSSRTGRGWAMNLEELRRELAELADALPAGRDDSLGVVIRKTKHRRLRRRGAVVSASGRSRWQPSAA